MAAEYLVPDESKDIFKLEKIPLRVDSMKELTKHLITIALRKQDNTVTERRCTAQLLAIAMRLDPANPIARETSQALKAGDQLKNTDQTSVHDSMTRTGFYMDWLVSPDAGTDANLLANYIADATRILQTETKENSDTVDWSGIVPPLEKYTDPNDTSTDSDTTNEKEIDESGQERESPDLPDKPAPTSKFHITETVIRTPIDQINRKKENDPIGADSGTVVTESKSSIATIKLLHKPCPPDQLPHLDLGRHRFQDRAIFRSNRRTLRAILRNRHSGLADYQSQVIISGGDYSSSNELALTAPLAVMLEASINNTPLREDIHICAAVDANSKMTVPANFWQSMKTLRNSSTGGRLIVPPAATELLEQILVFDEPEFFTRWEILSADSLDQAVAIATHSSTAELAEASKLFETIRAAASENAVTMLAVNSAVKTRLNNILALTPNHLSAKILLLQGSGKRPMRFSEQALAQELLPIVRKMHNSLNPATKPDADTFIYRISPKLLKSILEETRSELDKLEKMLDRSKDELFEEAVDQANNFRRLSTLNRRINDLYSDRRDREKARRLRNTMELEINTLLEKITLAADLLKPIEKKKNE